VGPMARTAHDTRDRLITAGQHLFAERGVFTVPLRTVIEQAGQKNTSALHYHFGGREGLLGAIIERHNAGIEAERSRMLAEIRASGLAGDIPSLVRAFVIPFSRMLASEQGREFLRIVAQLSDLFDLWAEGPPHTPVHAYSTLVLLTEAVPIHSRELRHQRCTTLLMLVSDALALRARQISSGSEPKISDDDFVANLIDMSIGALQAEQLSVQPLQTLQPLQ
jgi:TetR/AcrR family transcriptional regulator, regulator of cefoperazone and chloramphenicol sensitivity